MSNAEFGRLLHRVVDGESLGAEETAYAFLGIMSGSVPEVQIAAFLTALALRKPSVDEIVGAAQAMRSTMRKIHSPPDAIDLCGTGGDAHGTLNISTACAFVVAGAGVPVAKHGNRAMSSRSGGADVLEVLGARLATDAHLAAGCLKEAGICFLFAQHFHPAMKHAAPVRRALGFRTIFNLVGPLANPASVKRQLVGVYAPEWVEPIAEALKRLGAERAWVVHGNDGLDELSTSATTRVAVLSNGRVTTKSVSPDEAGVATSPLSQITGGNPEENARALRQLLQGEQGAYRDIVLLNTAAALVVAGRARDLKEGAQIAGRSLDTGAAKRCLDRFVAATQAR